MDITLMSSSRRRLAQIGLLAGILLSVSLAGCNPVKKDKMAVSLQDAVNGYQSALRWGYYDNALGYVDPEALKGKETPPSMEDIRLTGYDVVQPPIMKKDASTALQIVKIEYLYEDKQIVKTLTDRQIWRYDEEANKWWLQSGLPKFE